MTTVRARALSPGGRVPGSLWKSRGHTARWGARLLTLRRLAFRWAQGQASGKADSPRRRQCVHGPRDGCTRLAQASRDAPANGRARERRDQDGDLSPLGPSPAIPHGSSVTLTLGSGSCPPCDPRQLTQPKARLLHS